MKIARRLVLCLALATAGFSATACQSASAAAGTHLLYGPGEEMIRTELYFGSVHGGKTVVSPEQWQAFLSEVVTPRFPKGFTVLQGRGQWLDKTGLQLENSHVIVIFHPSTDEVSAAIEEIRADYKTKFQQESVIRVSEPARVAF